MDDNPDKLTEYLKLSGRHALLQGPPGSGKSTVLLRVLARSPDALLIEPLRALAAEKGRLIESMGGQTRVTVGGQPKSLSSDAVTVTTPEYFLAHLTDVKFRMAAVDELDMLRDPGRAGAMAGTLGVLLRSGARVLAAGVDVPRRLLEWDEIFDVHALLGDEPDISWITPGDPDDLLTGLVDSFLEERDDALILVFTATRARAEKTAARLSEHFPGAVAALHAGMDGVKRQEILQHAAGYRLRVVVATTALSIGLDLPFTHVIVRDPWVPGMRMTRGEILQLAGRARPHRGGKTVVFSKPPRSSRRPRMSSIALGWLHGGPDSWEGLEILGRVLGDRLLPLIRSMEEAGMIEWTSRRQWRLTTSGRAALGMGMDALSCALWLSFWLVISPEISSENYDISDFRLMLHILEPVYEADRKRCRKGLKKSILWRKAAGRMDLITGILGAGTAKEEPCVSPHPLEGNYLKLLKISGFSQI